MDEDGTQKKWTFTQQHCGVKQELQVSINGGSPIAGWLRENPRLKWMMAEGTPMYGTPPSMQTISDVVLGSPLEFPLIRQPLRDGQPGMIL